MKDRTGRGHDVDLLKIAILTLRQSMIMRLTWPLRAGPGVPPCLEVFIRADIRQGFWQKCCPVAPVWLKHRGWDLEAKRDDVTLRIEVKGTAQKEIHAELTPNEYAASDHDSSRVCVVTDALGEPQVHAFLRNFENIWYDENFNLRSESGRALEGERCTTSDALTQDILQYPCGSGADAGTRRTGSSAWNRAARTRRLRMTHGQTSTATASA